MFMFHTMESIRSALHQYRSLLLALLATVLANLLIELQLDILAMLMTLGFALALQKLASFPRFAPYTKCDLGVEPSRAKGLISYKRQRPEIKKGRSPPCMMVSEIMTIGKEQLTLRSAGRATALHEKLLGMAGDGVGMADAALAAGYQPIEVYTTLVGCVMKLGRCQRVKDIVEEMKEQGVARTIDFYEVAMRQLAGNKQPRLALGIYEQLAADGLKPSAITYSCLIGFALAVNDLQLAVQFFERLSALTTPSIRAYMCMLRFYGKRQDWHSSLALFRDMQRRGVDIDSIALNVVLATGMTAGEAKIVEGVLSEVELSKPVIVDVISYNTVIKCYSQEGNVQAAWRLINRMRSRGLHPNAITFNSAIDAAVRTVEVSEVWRILLEMRAQGLGPDQYTCSIVLKGLRQALTADHILACLKLLLEADAACDVSLKVKLYHAVKGAAIDLGDTSVLRQVFEQAQQLQAPSAPHKREFF